MVSLDCGVYNGVDTTAMSKADELRAMRERRSGAAANPAKTSRGGGESNERASRPATAADEQRRTAAQYGVGTAVVRIPKAKANVSGLRPKAGVATSPRETWGAKVIEFATAILYGDSEHRKWLLEASDAFAAGRPLPVLRPRPKSNDCPVCVARRQAKSASMAKWRAKKDG